MSKTIRFIGTLETIGPVAISLPKMGGNIPKNSKGIYYIPATSFRGALRSAATHGIAEVLNRSNLFLNVDEHYMNFSGVDTGRCNSLGGGYERLGANLKSREKNPHISLFGNFTLGGKLGFGSAYCLDESPVVNYGNGSRNHPFNRIPDLVDFVKPDELEYLQSIMEADALTAVETSDLNAEKKELQAKLKKLTGEDKKAAQAKIDELDELIRKIKDGRAGASESILRPLAGFEVIDAGNQLSHRMVLNNATDEELKYLLWALWKLSSNFYIGGHRNIGCGEVHASWKIIETSLSDPKPKTIGELSINDDGFVLTGIEFDGYAIDQKIANGEYDFSMS